MPHLLSVNTGTARHSHDSDVGVTGIDKRPAVGPVRVDRPDRRGLSGVAGDQICDARHHGGPDQAVYAYAREDLDWWQNRLGRSLRNGMFGENLTTSGLDITEALIGERWRVGEDLVLEAAVPRIPCRTFAGWLAERGWIATFTNRAAPGAYLRVAVPGTVSAGDPIEVVHRPDHDVTIGVVFRALTIQPELLPQLLAADELPAEVHRRVHARLPMQLDASA